MSKVIVLGAGLSGLASAALLARAGHEVTVLERHDWLGGKSRRVTVAGQIMDTGPALVTFTGVWDKLLESYDSLGEKQSKTAREIADEITELFIKPTEDGGVDQIYLVGNQFVSMMVQEPNTTRLLPLEIVEQEAEESEVHPLYEFEPEVEKVLDSLLPVYIENRIYNKMLQSAAAEHAARQKAMKSATDNAEKLILNYTRLSNQARQAEITQQISEIVGGADALSTVSED